MKEAMYWQAISEDGKIRCDLCPNRCIITKGRRGICRVRRNDNGRLIADNYGKVSSIAIDPVEKKPLYHFHPGGFLLSVGTFGCNLSCLFCQNWHISQAVPECKQVLPGELVNMTLEKRKEYPNLVGIAYTYNEPLTWYEFVRECAEKAGEGGLSNVLVTNGYIQEEALDGLLPFVDGLNVDVKAWSEEFYREYTGGKLAPVKRTVEKAVGKAWVEVTYLVIPGINDSEDDIECLCRWLKNLDPGIPLHLSRFFPAYRLKKPPTPVSDLEKFRDVAKEFLNHVYIGNVSGPGYADSQCPGCGKVLLERDALELRRSNLVDGECPQCHRVFDYAGKVWI